MEKLIMANWKLNIPRLTPWRKVRAPFGARAAVCPPFPYLKEVGGVIRGRGVALGAQDVFWEGRGAYTGEVSPPMLRSFGVEYAVVGHSERRRFLGETDGMAGRKVGALLKEGLTPVLCVGEPKEVRKRGVAAARRYVLGEIRGAFRVVGEHASEEKTVYVAYEPIWAISSGKGAKADDPKEALAMAVFIKEKILEEFPALRARVLYGGSLTPGNAAAFLHQKDIDGALVGGASLDAGEFQKILEVASRAFSSE